MATGGIFQLITNDGKQDRMLMATQLLKQRIDTARARRIAAGDSDCTPTLYDIERTHILFTNAHFKPFAAIGYEYNKVTSSAGASALGSSVTFSIPQFGDFFNDMVVHAIIQQPSLATGTAPDAGSQNLMRWCAYPGERLLKTVKFEVNGNPLDEYTRDAVNFHREFCVQPNKQTGWNRCIGQEEVENGSLDQPNWANNGYAASSVDSRLCVQSKSGIQTPTGPKTEEVELFIPLLFWCNKDPRLSVPSVAIPYGQRFITMELAESSELVGLVGRGVNAGDPYGLLGADVSATGGILGEAKLSTIELYINNIFVNPEVHNIFIKRIGFTLIRVHRKQVQVTNGGDESFLLQQLKWPIEALFVGVRMQEYNATTNNAVKRANLDKWHKFSHVSTVERLSQGWKSNKASVVSGLTLESVVPALAGTAVITAAAGDFTSAFITAGTAGEFAALVPGQVLSVTNANGVFTATVDTLDAAGTVVTFRETQDSLQLFDADAVHAAGNESATAASLATSTPTEVSSHVSVCTPTLTKVTIKAHGIPIYNDFPAKFYNAYLPYNYGGPNIRTPEDCGALMITFCLYPGTYQPSGHINVSRAREFYIDFTTTSVVTQNNPGTLIVIASAINFLLISDGSAVLRYST